MILRDMTEADLDQVLRIEQGAHTHPWTRGNFADALASAYTCKVLEQQDAKMLGYAVLMRAVDEAELLDITIGRDFQRQGWGAKLLEEMLSLARRQGLQRMVLEVRASNSPAIALYKRAGFTEIGLRRQYYPAQNGREDAILMGREL